MGEECTGLGVLVPQPATGTADPGAASAHLPFASRDAGGRQGSSPGPGGGRALQAPLPAGYRLKVASRSPAVCPLSFIFFRFLSQHKPVGSPRLCLPEPLHRLVVGSKRPLPPQPASSGTSPPVLSVEGLSALLCRSQPFEGSRHGRVSASILLGRGEPPAGSRARGPARPPSPLFHAGRVRRERPAPGGVTVRRDDSSSPVSSPRSQRPISWKQCR